MGSSTLQGEGESLNKTCKECLEAGKHVLHSYVDKFTDYCYACEREYHTTETFDRSTQR